MNELQTPARSVWRSVRLKCVADVVNVRLEGDLASRPCIGLEHIESHTGRLIENPGTASTDGLSNSFDINHVLFGKLRPYLAKVLKPDFAGRCTSELLILHPRLVHRDFLYWFCLSDWFLKTVDSSTYGAKMPRASWEFIGNLPISFPEPLEEQRAIAGFLDSKTAAIDALIAKRVRLIELLDEKRQTIVTEAVTHGLHTGASLKESGVPWYGPVPSHWSIVRLSVVAEVVNGSTPSRDRLDYWDGDVPWVSSGKVNEYFVTSPSECITAAAQAAHGLRLMPRGTVLLGMIGQGRTRGMSACLTIPACINQNVAGIVPRAARLDSRYLHHVLTHAYEPIRQVGRGGQQEALNCEIIKAFRIPLPPVVEQKEIGERLDSVIAQSSTVVASMAAQIESLREYRQALISAAVTGQIDIPAELAEVGV